MEEDEELKEYEKLVEKEKSNTRKLPEVPLAENVASMNMTQATRANAGDPTLAANINKNAPKWVKPILLILAILIILGIVSWVVYTIFFFLK